DFLREEFSARHRIQRCLGEDHVASRLIEIAEESIESRDGSTGLCGIRMLADSIVHEHADWPMRCKQVRGAFHLVGGHPGNCCRCLGAVTRCELCKSTKHGPAKNFAAIFGENSVLSRESGPNRLPVKTTGGGIVDNGDSGDFVPRDESFWGSTAFQLGLRQNSAAVQSSQKKSIRPLTNERFVVNFLLDYDVDERQGHGAVGARPTQQQLDGLPVTPLARRAGSV